jgi:hypothetical protein
MGALIRWLAQNIHRPFIEWIANVFIYPVLEVFIRIARRAVHWVWATFVLIAGYFAEELFRIGKHVFKYISARVWELAMTMVETIVGFIPAESQPDLASLQEYINAANAWVPLDVGLTLFSVYWLLFTQLAALRIIKKYVPFT